MSDPDHAAQAGGSVSSRADLGALVAEAKQSLARDVPDAPSGVFRVRITVEELPSDQTTLDGEGDS